MHANFPNCSIFVFGHTKTPPLSWHRTRFPASCIHCLWHGHFIFHPGFGFIVQSRIHNHHVFALCHNHANEFETLRCNIDVFLFGVTHDWVCFASIFHAFYPFIATLILLISVKFWTQMSRRGIACAAPKWLRPWKSFRLASTSIWRKSKDHQTSSNSGAMCCVRAM